MNQEAIHAVIDAWLPKAQQGDHAAFGRIVAACQGGITAIALAMVRDVQASEDIAQDAFVSAWRNLDRLRKPSSFLPWLRQITRNLARDHLRRRKTERRSDAEFDDVLAYVADPSDTQADMLERQETNELLSELLDDLPEESRELLLIFYREGQSSKQVSELLGIRDATVRKRLQRARQALKANLLARMEKIAKDTAPTAVFTAVVMGGLASSSTAQAGVSSTGFVMKKSLAKGLGKGAGKWLPKTLASLGFAGKSTPKLLLGAVGGVVLAAVIGLASLVFGLRGYWLTAFDAKEKRELTRLGLVSGVFVLVLTLVMISALLNHQSKIGTLAFVLLLSQMALLKLFALPDVLSRRHAAEAKRDPHGAMQARKQERHKAWMSVLMSVLMGVVALWFGWFQV